MNTQEQHRHTSRMAQLTKASEDFAAATVERFETVERQITDVERRVFSAVDDAVDDLRGQTLALEQRTDQAFLDFDNLTRDAQLKLDNRIAAFENLQSRFWLRVRFLFTGRV